MRVRSDEVQKRTGCRINGYHAAGRCAGVGQGSETGADVNGGDIVFRIAQMLRVFEDLVCGGGNGQRVLERLSQLQRQPQVLLHVAQRHFAAGQESVRVAQTGTRGLTWRSRRRSWRGLSK